MAAGGYGDFLSYVSSHAPSSVAMVAGSYFPSDPIDFQVNEKTGRFTLKYDHESVAKVEESAVGVLEGAVVTFAKEVKGKITSRGIELDHGCVEAAKGMAHPALRRIEAVEGEAMGLKVTIRLGKKTFGKNISEIRSVNDFAMTALKWIHGTPSTGTSESSDA